MTLNPLVGICSGLQQGASLTCRVSVTGGGLEIYRDRDLIGVLPYQGLRIAVSGVNNRYLSFQNTTQGKNVVLLVSDREIIGQIEGIGAPGSVMRQLQDLTRSQSQRALGRSLVIGAVGLAIVGIVLVGYVGMGLLEKKIISSIPLEWELELGRNARERLLSQQRLCEDPAPRPALQEIGMRLIGALGASPYRFQVNVIASDDVNGFALPGGDIFLTQGLIEQSERGEEVAGVIAHEIQHVLSRHGLGNLARRAGLYLLVSAFFGEMGALEQFIMFNGAELMSMSFSRAQEEEADRLGLILLGKAQLARDGLPSFLERLAEERQEGNIPRLFSIFSTHPASEERVETLRAMIRENPGQQVKPLEADWSTTRILCSPTMR